MKMLGCKEAAEVINQLRKETFLCNEDMLITNGYIIIKKSGDITTNNIIQMVQGIKKKELYIPQRQNMEKPIR